MLRKLKRLVANTLPASLRPAAKYHYRLLRSRLDPELPIICEGLGPGSVAIDVGANEGVFTHAFLRTGATVEAFEPQAACLSVLKALERRQPRLRVHSVALGSRAGDAELFVPRDAGELVSGHASLSKRGSDGETELVPLKTLDSFGFTRADVMKIDVEGHEYDVLLGSSETIRRCRPRLLVEIEQRHMTRPIQDVFRMITDAGYTGSFFLAGRRHALGDFDLRGHQRTAVPDDHGALYVNNFLFEPT